LPNASCTPVQLRETAQFCAARKPGVECNEQEGQEAACQAVRMRSGIGALLTLIARRSDVCAAA
jgi:hypothetical protein